MSKADDIQVLLKLYEMADELIEKREYITRVLSDFQLANRDHPNPVLEDGLYDDYNRILCLAVENIKEAIKGAEQEFDVYDERTQ